MKLLCDENIPLCISKNVASNKHKVINVGQEYPGIKDEEVFQLALKEKLCIVTSDHHFDRFKHKNNFGIIRLSGNLKNMDIRLKEILRQYKTKSIANTYIKINNMDYKIETNKYHKNKNKKEHYEFNKKLKLN